MLLPCSTRSPSHHQELKRGTVLFHHIASYLSPALRTRTHRGISAAGSDSHYPRFVLFFVDEKALKEWNLFLYVYNPFTVEEKRKTSLEGQNAYSDRSSRLRPSSVEV